jgi:hypothetical protein
MEKVATLEAPVAGPQSSHPRLQRLFLEAVMIPALLYGLLMLSIWWTITHLPAGRAFVLEPRGSGRLYDISIGVLAMGGFGLLYVLPTLRVRRSIGCLLRLLMFTLFVVLLTELQSNKCVAVVQTSTGYVFIRPAPFGSETKSYSEVSAVRLRKTGAVTVLHIGEDPRVGPDLRPVYHVDKQTNKVLSDLLYALAATGTAIEGG